MANRCFLVFLGACLLLSSVALCPAKAADIDGDSVLVPQHLLGMIHAPQSHAELKLTEQQIADLERLFSQIDPIWFRSRLLPVEQQRKVVEGLEQQVRTWFAENVGPKQQQRLEQMELYALGVRMLLRDDLAKRLGIDEAQRSKLVAAARATVQAEAALKEASKAGKPAAQWESKLQQAATDEKTMYKQTLTEDQLTTLNEILGPPFDTGQLSRIFPMAPEFVPVENWINSPPLKVSNLRGKVLLVHFYAFECHNCQANFEIYKRWHRQLASSGVVVIGIQTPETSHERDARAVRSAAAAEQLQFPILIDLKSENWKNWGNTMWPTVYVVDKRGYIRHWWQGELNWNGATGDKTIETLVETLLQEK